MTALPYKEGDIVIVLLSDKYHEVGALLPVWRVDPLLQCVILPDDSGRGVPYNFSEVMPSQTTITDALVKHGLIKIAAHANWEAADSIITKQLDALYDLDFTVTFFHKGATPCGDKFEVSVTATNDWNTLVHSETISYYHQEVIAID